MNSIKEIERINQRELELGLSGKGSWHDEYKESAYVFVGGISFEMTEGDVVTVFSQFGELMDINMPRDKETGKPRGFCFLMYEDQKSTVLAVDNMNGAQVLGRTIRVDHVRKYVQPGAKDDDGKYQPPEEPTYNAAPPFLSGSESSSEEEDSDNGAIDEEDPMAAFLRAEKKGKKKIKNGEKSSEKAEKRRRKEERARIREERARKKVKKEGRSEEGRSSTSRKDEGRSEEGRSSTSRKDEGRRRSRSPERSKGYRYERDHNGNGNGDHSKVERDVKMEDDRERRGSSSLRNAGSRNDERRTYNKGEDMRGDGRLDDRGDRIVDSRRTDDRRDNRVDDRRYDRRGDGSEERIETYRDYRSERFDIRERDRRR